MKWEKKRVPVWTPLENVTSLGWSMFRGGVRASGSTAGISSLKPAAGFECTSGVT